MYFVNGQQQDVIPISDRSFQYGDGCFTTILVKEGQLQAWTWHQKRLHQTTYCLRITSIDWEQVFAWLDLAMESYQRQSDVQTYGIKLHISRGYGGRGYSPQVINGAQVCFYFFPLPEKYATWQQAGIKLGVSQIHLGINPQLAGLKHNNRLEQVLIKADLEEQGYEEGIVLDQQQHVIEACAANIFWCHNETLYTPDLTSCGVAGVMRAQILTLAADLFSTVNVGQFSLTELYQADEIFITNAIHGVVPVTQILTNKFAIGSGTRTIQKELYLC